MTIHPIDRKSVIEHIERDPVDAYRQYRSEEEAAALLAIPSHCRRGVVRYILCGVPTGSFLRAVFACEWGIAKLRADVTNLAELDQYREFLHTGAPAACYGSSKAVREWTERSGFVGSSNEQHAENRKK